MTFIFWASTVILFYTYAGYPLLIYVLARCSKASVRKDMLYKPTVSIVISAYNEKDYIETKIMNILESEYPKEKLEILVGSDGSGDGTAEALLRIATGSVKAFVFDRRRGKPSVLNDLMARATGDIVVFLDVRQAINKQAIANLVSNFADERVGCVSGELVFSDVRSESGAAEGVGLYWEYEKLIRKYESAFHSMVGATGAIYAIRRDLYSPIPADTILDDVYTPLAIARQGYRCLWDSEAKALDKVADNAEAEYRKKVRTLAGNYQIFVMFKDLFLPGRSPVTLQLISHKLLRILAPFFMIFAFLSNVSLVKNGIYGLFLALQIMFYILAVAGKETSKKHSNSIGGRITSTAYMFCIMNFAALAGLYRFLLGKQSVMWNRAGC